MTALFRNLELVGNASSWGGLQYVVHGLSWFIFWGCGGKEWPGDRKFVAGGSHQLGTGVLALKVAG